MRDKKKADDERLFLAIQRNCRSLLNDNKDIEMASQLPKDSMTYDAECFLIRCIGNAVHDLSDAGIAF